MRLNNISNNVMINSTDIKYFQQSDNSLFIKTSIRKGLYVFET